MRRKEWRSVRKERRRKQGNKRGEGKGVRRSSSERLDGGRR